MDAFYIVSLKNKELLLSKEFAEEENTKIKNKEILQSFLYNEEKVFSQKVEQNSSFLRINGKLLIYQGLYDESSHSQDIDLLYLILTNEESCYIPTFLKFISTFNSALTLSFGKCPDKSLIHDNIILVLLMLDHFCFKGIPTFSDPYILASMTNPYGLTDKISEKIMGVAKSYNTEVYNSFLSNNESSKMHLYVDEPTKKNAKLYFDYFDNISLILDKKTGNIISNKCYSEIIYESSIVKPFDLSVLLSLPFKIVSLSKDSFVYTKKKDILKKNNIDFLCKHGKNKLLSIVPELQNHNIKLPFGLKTESSVTNDKMKIMIYISLLKNDTLNSDNGNSNEEKKVEETNKNEITNINIELNFNEDDDVNTIIKNVNLAPSYGEFEFNENKKKGFWHIKKLGTEHQDAVLKGILLLNHKNKNKNNPSSDNNNENENTKISENNEKEKNKDKGNNDKGLCSIGCNCILNLSCDIEGNSVTNAGIGKINIPKSVDYSVGKVYHGHTKIKDLEIVF